jgi:hypothetical protein
MLAIQLQRKTLFRDAARAKNVSIGCRKIKKQMYLFNCHKFNPLDGSPIDNFIALTAVVI